VSRRWLIPWWQIRKRIQSLLMERRIIAMGRQIEARTERRGALSRPWPSDESRLGLDSYSTYPKKENT